MRISFLLSSLWFSGGVRDIIEIANRLVMRGHQVNIIIPGGTRDPDMDCELHPGIRLTETTVAGSRGMSLARKIRLAWALASLVPPSDFVISTQAPTTAAGFIAGKILKRGRLVWFYQDYLEMFSDRPVESWLVRNALRWHKLAMTLSEASRQELLAYFPGKVVVAGAGLSHAEVFLAASKGAARSMEKPFYKILFLGDMRPRKGLYDFLEAAGILFRKMPNIRLVIVSKEPCRVQSQLPFEIIYRPTRPELAQLYANCDIYVSASWWESFGLPPLEAMAAGAVVVMTDSRGSRDYAIHNFNSLVVPPRNPQQLAKAMEAVLTDHDLANRLRSYGPETARRFTWDLVADRFEKALLEAS
jgi:glycosyltransferase involved in cell wall biosynthesis